MAHVIHADGGNFKSEVIEAEIPVFVDFWAEWCGPCKSMSPMVDAIAQELGESVKVVKVDLDENDDLGEELGVRSLPTLMLFRGGTRVAVHSGAASKAEMLDFIRSNS